MESAKIIEKLKNIFTSKRNIIIISTILIALVLIIGIFCTIFSIINMNNTKIIKGVAINNIDVSELTKEEAKEKLNARNRIKKTEYNKAYKR